MAKVDPVRLAGVQIKHLSVREAIIEAARACWNQGYSPNVVIVSPSRYEWLQTWQAVSAVADDIGRMRLTYERRTTLLGMLHAGWRISERHQRRFDPKAWWRKHRPTPARP